jgi:putative pyruvate formate lyase activating enzyme
MTHKKVSLLKEKSNQLSAHLKDCHLCPRNCGANRLKGEVGYCKAGAAASIYTVFKHFGEEPAITSQNGSGTIFFSGCSLGCVYCQNYKFSHTNTGTPTDEETLAHIMLALQKKKATNINLVTPTHYLPQILTALLIATEKGLAIPIVYNTSGYEKKEIIEHLEGIVDIYLTDLKYLSPDCAQIYSNARDYPSQATDSIVEMNRQVKQQWEKDILLKGLIIRHLALPEEITNSDNVLRWIKNNTPECLLSLMFQFQPYFKSIDYPKINRKINLNEYLHLKRLVGNLNLEGWVQGHDASEELAGVHFEQPVEDFIKNIT